ncbi:hypothetical protein LEMLEM_LOCUS12711, partial [Lemmus lemmus]
GKLHSRQASLGEQKTPLTPSPTTPESPSCALDLAEAVFDLVQKRKTTLLMTQHAISSSVDKVPMPEIRHGAELPIVDLSCGPLALEVGEASAASRFYMQRTKRLGLPTRLLLSC